jgi:hypothetical protein
MQAAPALKILISYEMLAWCEFAYPLRPNMLILGIESSCDETGFALWHTVQGLVAEQLHSQIALHQPYCQGAASLESDCGISADQAERH